MNVCSTHLQRVEVNGTLVPVLQRHIVRSERHDVHSGREGNSKVQPCVFMQRRAAVNSSLMCGTRLSCTCSTVRRKRQLHFLL